MSKFAIRNPLSRLKRKQEEAVQKKRDEAQAKIDRFVEAEAKLEDEHGVEVVATMRYTENGAFPILQARVKLTPDVPKDSEESGQQAGS